MNELDTLQGMGLTLPSPAYLFGALLFGIFGIVAWRHGRRNERPVTQWLGLALMLYPYAVSDTALLYGFGAGLTALAWHQAQ